MTLSPQGHPIAIWISTLAVVVLGLALTLVVPPAFGPRTAAQAETPTSPPPERPPAALHAERAFFAAFNHGTMSAEETLAPLMGAWALAPSDPRTNMLVGVAHLWIASTADRSDPPVLENVLLAEHFLQRAQELAPEDGRIPSWLVPMRLVLASTEGRREDHREILSDLYDAYREDPTFHSFMVARLGWNSPPGSRPFELGLEALRAVREGTCGGDPSCLDQPRWPHNVEGLLSFAADYELRAGNLEGAREVLAELTTLPSYPSWPYRDRVEARAAALEEHAGLFADDDPTNDPPTAVITDGCAVCHSAAKNLVGSG